MKIALAKQMITTETINNGDVHIPEVRLAPLIKSDPKLGESLFPKPVLVPNKVLFSQGSRVKNHSSPELSIS